MYPVSSCENKLTFDWYKFSELTTDQLYKILMLRSDVFVVEQQCCYLDIDGKDNLALHLLGMQQDLSLAAYLRLFPPTHEQDYVSFGRVVIHSSVRKCGYGRIIMQELLSYSNHHFAGVTIKCSAQYHLVKFYAEFGFKPIGHKYDEDGIPHIMMEKV